MIAYVTALAGGDFDSFKNTGATSNGGNNEIALRQNWVGAKGLPFLPSGSMAWVGKRYYHRNDVHEIDFFYWDTSGFGGGLDDLPIGPAKFALAVFETKVNDRRVLWQPDFRVYGIPLVVIPDGTLEAGVSLVIDSSTENSVQNPNKEDISPWLTVQWVQNNFLRGFNKLAFQYGQGAAANMHTQGSQNEHQYRHVRSLQAHDGPDPHGRPGPRRLLLHPSGDAAVRDHCRLERCRAEGRYRRPERELPLGAAREHERLRLRQGGLFVRGASGGLVLAFERDWSREGASRLQPDRRCMATRLRSSIRGETS